MKIRRNTTYKTLDFLIMLDGKNVHFEKGFWNSVKAFFKLPFYELVTIYDDEGNVKEAYLTKVYPRKGVTYVY